MIDDDRRELHRLALEIADRHVTTIRASDLDRPTPCQGWTLGNLLAHVVGQHLGFSRAVRDGDAPAAAYAPVPFDLGIWRASVEELVTAFATAPLDGMAVQIELSGTPLPLRRILDAQLIDTVVHTWDIAHSLGRSFAPPGPLLAVVASVAAEIPDRAYGSNTAFGSRLPGADTQWGTTLALTGRRVSEEDRS